MKKQFKLDALLKCQSSSDGGCLEPHRLRVMKREKSLKLFKITLEDIEWMRDNFQLDIYFIYREIIGFVPDNPDKVPMCKQIFKYRKELRELWMAEKNALNKLIQP